MTMNCPGILFEEPDVPNTCICEEGAFFVDRKPLRLALEVDRDCAADVSNLTEDSIIMSSYLNDSSLTTPSFHHNEDADDNDDRDNNSKNIFVAKGRAGVKSKWLSTVLKRRKARREGCKLLQTLEGATGTVSTPETLGTVDETCSVSSTSSNNVDPNCTSLSDGVKSPNENDNVRKRSKKAKKSLTLDVDEYDDHRFENVVQDLRGQTDLTKLEVYRNNPGRGETSSRSIADLGKLFSEVGGLSQLEELVLWNFTSDCSWMLTCFLKDRPPALRSFRLHHARGSLSKELLETLVQVPTLTDIVLEMEHDFPFDILFYSSSLRTLKINGNYDIGWKSFSRAMRILGRTNRTLQMLDLKPSIATAHVRGLAEAIQRNPTLEKLYFSFCSDYVDDSGGALVDFAKALTQNHSLKEVVNRNHRSVQVSTDNSMFAHAFLESNKTLERFEFYNKQACVDRSGREACIHDSVADATRVSIDNIMSLFALCGTNHCA